jgi:probable HAF family extracellular repeat protein
VGVAAGLGAALLVSVPVTATAASFQGLGYLPGGKYLYSSPLDVSADGSVIVGESQSANGMEAFRWTAAAGMVG